MFEDLKTQLAAIEGKLRAALGGLETRVGTLEAQIKTIDAPMVSAFDRFDASVGRVRGIVDQRIQGVRDQIGKLRP